MKQDFSKKKVGDPMWSVNLGDCDIIEITDTFNYPIRCRNKLGREATYTFKGCYNFNDICASLFESNPFENQFQERVMEVSDDGNDWYKCYVVGKFNGGFVVKGKVVCHYLCYKYAREIKEKQKVTLELTDEQIKSLKEQGII